MKPLSRDAATLLVCICLLCILLAAVLGLWLNERDLRIACEAGIFQQQFEIVDSLQERLFMIEIKTGLMMRPVYLSEVPSD